MTGPLDLPASLADALRDYAWSRATDGGSGGAVLRLDAVNRQSLFVKHGVGTVADDIAAEHARLQWLALRIPVPAVRYFEQRVVDISDFDDERAGWTATAVWDSITAMLPLPFERVLTHGDCSLGNVPVANGRVTGCIDVGRAGVVDPYQDLALLWNNLREFGEPLAARWWKEYGIVRPDERRLALHLGLDELFQAWVMVHAARVTSDADYFSQRDTISMAAAPQIISAGMRSDGTSAITTMQTASTSTSVAGSTARGGGSIDAPVMISAKLVDASRGALLDAAPCVAVRALCVGDSRSVRP